MPMDRDLCPKTCGPVSHCLAALCCLYLMSFPPSVSCRMEDEAVVDRGASYVKHVCDEEEVEGMDHTPKYSFSLAKVSSIFFSATESLPGFLRKVSVLKRIQSILQLSF